MERTLHQAVYNLKLEGDMFDGTFLAQPVIRVIDAHLKLVLINFNIIPNATYVKGRDGYDMFDKLGTKYILKADRYGKANEKEAQYIGNCYTFFSNNRNVLSHRDDPTTPLDTTTLLNTAKAHDLIKRTLKLIDEYYKLV